MTISAFAAITADRLDLEALVTAALDDLAARAIATTLDELDGKKPIDYSK